MSTETWQSDDDTPPSLKDRVLAQLAAAVWRMAEVDERAENPVSDVIRALESDLDAIGDRRRWARPESRRGGAVVPYRSTEATKGGRPRRATRHPEEERSGRLPESPSWIDGVLRHVRESKVAHWGIAYLAFAFAGVGLVDDMGDIWGWSLSFQRAVVTLLACGLPPVLVVSWFHGEKGRQRAPLIELLILGSLLALSIRLLYGVGVG